MKVTLFESRVIADEMRSDRWRVGPGPASLVSLREEEVRTQRQRHGRRRPCEDHGRDWGDTAASSAAPRIPNSHQTSERSRKDPPQSLSGSPAPRFLSSGFCSPRLREDTFL